MWRAALYAFDGQIELLCRAVESVSNAIVTKHPQFIATAE